MNLIVDTTNLITRAYYAFPENDDRTWGIYGCVNMMLDIIKHYNPNTIHFCFDTSVGVSWRKQLYPEYKANRKPKPEYLPYQLDLAKQTMKRVGLSVYEHQATEADDLVATLCHKLEGQKTILSSDKDLMQLLSHNVNYIRYTKHFKDHEIITVKSFYQDYGFFPEWFGDWIALVGDTGDNIPGAKGIGPVAATKLIKEYSTIPNMISNFERGNGLAKVASSKANVEMSYRLIKLATVVSLPVQSGEYSVGKLHMIAKIVNGE
jgi:DNA polymerase-1